MHNYTLKEPVIAPKGQPPIYGNLKIAIDVHAHFYVSCLQIEGQKPQPPRKFTPSKFIEWITDLAARAQSVHTCYEAGPTGFALHRQLTALGIKNIVIVPTKTDETGKRVVNDKTDTLMLASRLDRYVAGNTAVFSVVAIPTPEQEQARALPRFRKQLATQRLSMASQGRSLCLTQGIALSNQWWQDKQWGNVQKIIIPAWVVEQLKVLRQLILKINEQMALLQIQMVNKQEKGKPRPKGMGPILKETIDSEVRGYSRFTSWRKIGSYSGLTGGVSSSGQSHADLCVTKHGNTRLRTALVELVWLFLRYQPDYWLTKKWKSALSGHTRKKKKAVVAYARQLLVDLWRIETGRAKPEQLGLIMVTA